MAKTDNIEFLNKFLNKSPYPFAQIENSKIIFANPAARRILGIKKGGKLSGEINKSAAEAAKSGKQADVEFNKGKKTYLLSLKALKKKGTINLYSTDITSFKKTGEVLYSAVKKLRKTEDQLQTANKKLFNAGMKYRTLFEKSRDAIMTLDPANQRFTSGNPASVEIFKAGTESSFTSMTPWQLSPEVQPDGRKSSVKAKEMIKKAMEEGSSFFEWTHKTLSGKEFPATVLLSRMETDEEVFILATVRDITKQKQDRDAIQKRLSYEHLLFEISSKSISEEKLNSFLKSSLASMGRTIDVSRAHIFKYNENAQTVSNIFEWCSKDFSSLKKNMQNIPCSIYSWGIEVLKGSRYICFSDACHIPSEKERKLLLKEGVLSIFIAPLFVRGEFFGFIGFEECSKIRDWQKDDIDFLLAISRIISSVIEHHHAEDELRKTNAILDSVVENIPKMMLFLKDAEELRFIRFNKAGEELLGISRSELYGKNDHDFFPKEQADFFTKKDREVLKGKKVIDIPEEPIMTRDGGERILHTIKVPILNEKGKAEYLLGISDDITERKRAEEEILRLKQQIEFILGATRTGLDIVDAEFNIVYMDPEWAKIYNGDPAGKKCYKYFMGRNKVCPGCGVKKALETKKPVVTEKRMLKEGNRCVQITSIPFQDKNGERLIAEVNVDITERKKMEEELKQREKYNRSIIEVLPDIIIRTNKEGEYLDVITPAEEKPARSKKTIIGKKINEVLPAPEAALVMKAIQKSIDEDCMQVVEYKLTVPAGNLWFEARIISFEDNDVFALIRDITNKKKAQAELAESELRYRTLADSGHALIWTSGTDRKRNYFNKPWLEFTGRTLDQELGDGWTEGVHPEDLTGFLQAYAKAFDRREPYSIEYRLRHVSGQYRWILDDGTPRFNIKGGFIGYIGHCLDITERKRSEEYVEKQAMLNSIVAGISSNFINVTAENIDEKLELMLKNCGEFFSVDRAYLITVSPDGRKMTNTHEWCREGIETQKDIVQGFPTETLPWFMDNINSEGYVSIEDVDELSEEASAEKKEFKRQNIKSVLCVPVRNSNDRLTGLMGLDAVRSKKKWEKGPVSLLKVLANIASDAQENVKIENQMAQAQKMETVGRLAGWISRDYSKIISSIIKDTELVLKEAKASGKEDRDIKKIFKAANKLADMTEQLNTFTETQPDLPEKIDINKEIKNTLKIILSLIGDNISVDWKPGKDRMTVKMDSEQLKQVLMNLAVNARDAIAEKGKIRIETSAMDIDDDFARKYNIQPGKYAKIIFRDDGKGMDQEIITHIFEPGFSGKEHVWGTGLGLSTVYSIVKKSGGFIEVLSQPGEGANFEIHLPVFGK